MQLKISNCEEYLTLFPDTIDTIDYNAIDSTSSTLDSLNLQIPMKDNIKEKVESN